jgi:deoxycytidine triphosphate deaminase
VGRRIAQIVFFHVGPLLEKDYTKTGKYQTTTMVNKMKKEWTPLSMLPKLYNDREARK